jgi:hypothetical protein
LTDLKELKRIRDGLWIGNTFVKAENARLDRKSQNLFLKDVVVFTIREKKGVGALFRGSFRIPLTSEEEATL